MSSGGNDSELQFLRNGLKELDEFDKRCCLFLERMRHVSSYELVQKFKSFINEYVGVQHDSPEECSQSIHTFIEDVFAAVREHPLWREEGDEAWDYAAEAAERYLMVKLYKMTYVLPCTSDISDDGLFHHRVRTLQFLKTEHLDIPERHLNRVAMEMAAKELHRADSESMKSPREKLTCILNSIMILSNLLKYYGDESGTGADDLLPYLIFTILILSPYHMHSNIRYISRFRREAKLKSEAAYYFTQMESAVLFIMDVNHTNLSISEHDFKKGINKCEEVIKSGLDINHFTASSFNCFDIRRPLLDSSQVVTSSPILARKASIIEEWTNLQRTRAMSQSEDDHRHINTPTTADTRTGRVDVTLPGTTHFQLAATTTGMGLKVDVVQSVSKNKEGCDVGGSTEEDMKRKFITARFEDLTISELKKLLTSYQVLAAMPPSHQD